MSFVRNPGNSLVESSSDDVEELEKMVMAFRMQELKSLLTSALQPSHGRKSDMLTRALTLIRTTKNEMVKRKVRQLYWHIYDKDRALLEANYTGPSGATFSGVGNGVSPYGIYGPSVPVTAPPKPNIATSRSVPSLMTQGVNRSNVELHPNVKLTHMPFYDMLREVLKPTSLVPMASGKYQENHISFTLGREQLNMLSYNEKAPLPRTELQLRFCLLDTKTDQKDDFPSQCVLRMNDRVVTLPNVIPTNKVGVEAKRPSRPVDITPHVATRGTGDQRIHVSWQSDGIRIWTVSVYIVRHLNAAILFERVKNKGERPESESIRMISEKLGNDDRDIATTSLRVSLLCPLGKIRMRLPCRLRSCKHLQCFDLELFLHMNEKKPTWTCPVCDAPTVPFSDLQIDGFFTRLLAQTTSESEVELYEGGGFASISNGDAIDLDNEDRPKGGRTSSNAPSLSTPITSATQSATQSKPPPSATEQSNTDNDCEIIDLISDDEDDSNYASKSRCISATSSDAPNNVVGTVRSPSSSPSLIILDSPSPTAGKSTPEDPRMSGEESTSSAAREQSKRSLGAESSDSTESSPKRFRYMGNGATSTTTTSAANFTSAPADIPNFPDMVRQLMTAMPLPTPPFSTSSYTPVPLPPRMGQDNAFGWKPMAPSSNGVSSSTGDASSGSSQWAPHLTQEFEAFLKTCFPPTSQ